MKIETCLIVGSLFLCEIHIKAYVESRKSYNSQL